MDDVAEPTKFGVAMFKVQEDIGEICLAATAGYRADAIKAGFSEGAADQLAVDWHRHLLDHVFSS